MDSFVFIDFVFQMLRDIANTVNSVSIRIGNFTVPIFSMLVTGLIIAMVASVFVKGAKG